jgi:hypothetical protein
MFKNTHLTPADLVISTILALGKRVTTVRPILSKLTAARAIRLGNGWPHEVGPRDGIS